MNSGYRGFNKGSQSFFKNFSKSFHSQYNNKFQSNLFNSSINNNILKGMLNNSFYLQKVKFLCTASFIQKTMSVSNNSSLIQEFENSGLDKCCTKLSLIVGFELMQLLTNITKANECKLF